MLKIRNISQKYPKNKNSTIENFSLELQKGEIRALLGPNGCGKSTLLRCIAGLIPYNGSIEVSGFSGEYVGKHRLVGMSFQSPALIEWESVYDNVALPSKFGRSNKPDRKYLYECIEMVGLSDSANTIVSHLSGGMQQRVGLARAIAGKPRLILLDEPFTGLDIVTKSSLLDIFRKVLKEKNITTLLVSHSAEEGIFLADTITILSASSPLKIIETKDNSEPIIRSRALFNNNDFSEKTKQIRQAVLSHWLDYEEVK